MLKLKVNIGLLLILFLLGACSTTTQPEREFPLSEEYINGILKSEGLSWESSLIENLPNKEDRSSFQYKDEHNKQIGIINSYRYHGKKLLVINFLIPSVDNSSTVALRKEQWETMFRVAGRLYGDIHFEQQYQPFINSFHERNSREFGRFSWYQSDKNVYSVVTMQPMEKSRQGYHLQSISLMDKKVYEEYMKDNASIWGSSIQSKYSVFQNLTIAEINKKAKESTEPIVFVSKFSMENLSRADKDDLSDKYYEGDGFLTARISDSSGKLDVLVKQKAYSAEELKQEREHYIIYRPEDSQFVVEYAVME